VSSRCVGNLPYYLLFAFHLLASFAFTGWRFIFTLTYKRMTRNDVKPPATLVVLDMIDVVHAGTNSV